jgi:hypothetical protein
MYPEVSCPSRLLYSIYTGREAQCNTTNNYTQYIILTVGNIEVMVGLLIVLINKMHWDITLFPDIVSHP